MKKLGQAMFDTHAHLNFQAFEPDLLQVITRAAEAGVADCVVVGTNLANSARAVEIAEQWSRPGQIQLWAAVGIHPHHVWPLLDRAPEAVEPPAELLDLHTSQLTTLASHPKVVAIGETGLDFHAYPTTKYSGYAVTDQLTSWRRAFFRLQWQAAVAEHLSLVIHNRQASVELLAELKQLLAEEGRPRQLVLHCCEPDELLLAFAVQNGIYLGVDGDVTYDLTKQAFVRDIPLELLVLETDAPFFKPEVAGRPGQNKRSEPADLVHISAFLADFLELPIEKIQAQTTANAKQLFGL